MRSAWSRPAENVQTIKVESPIRPRDASMSRSMDPDATNSDAIMGSGDGCECGNADESSLRRFGDASTWTGVR